MAFQILKQAIQKKSLKWEKKPERKLCWELYSQGLTTYEIASRCNKKQSWVSKRLEEKHHAEIISQEAALELIDFPKLKLLTQDPERLERMIAAFRNHLKQPEQEGDIAPIRKCVLEILKQ